MNQTSLTFTVFFKDPFWIGLFEYRENQMVHLKQIVFGSEPSNQQVDAWITNNWYTIRFQKPVETIPVKAVHRNPKRIQREVRRAQESSLPCTKAQLAKKQQQEERAVQNMERRKESREEQRNAFRLRQMKKKAKHRGH